MADRDLYFVSEEQAKRYRIKKILTNILVYGFLTVLGLFIVLPQ